MTKYHVRIVEQSLQDFVKTSLNGTGDVTFPVKWDSMDVCTAFGGPRAFVAITKDGMTIKLPSVNNGAELLARSRKTIEVVMNHDTYVSCPGIGTTARFFEEGQNLIEKSPYVNLYNVPDLVTPIDLFSLPHGKIFAYDESFEAVATFNSATEAAETCGLGQYYNVTRYVNKRFVKIVLYGVAMNVFFAMHPFVKGRTKPVVLTDVTTGVPVEYSSANACARALGLATAESSFVRRYVNANALFRNKYNLCYLADYKGPTPLRASAPNK